MRRSGGPGYVTVITASSNKAGTLPAKWMAAWPEALALWSKYTLLRNPRLCATSAEARREGLDKSFAMIRLADKAVIVDLQQIQAHGLGDYAPEILAHEIGHHVYAPADLTDHARMIARMRRALPTKEHLAGFVANLYTDLLINDRLQRSARLRMGEVYRKLGGGSSDRMWALYMRIYEILWGLPRGHLTAGTLDDQQEGDATLAVRVLRSYAREWVDGAGRFAAICLPYLLQDDGKRIQQLLQGWRDTENAGAGAEVPAGLSEREAGEREGAIHPASEDGEDGEEGKQGQEGSGQDVEASPRETEAHRQAAGQCREPFEYGEILRSAGLTLTPHELAVRYYRERALPHLIPFPVREIPQSQEPLAEGVETWDVSSPVEDIDWIPTVLRSPRVVPGLTTVERVWGVMEGANPKVEAVDLDLYVDSSGSMPNPQAATSFLTLAGAIVALSALRAGARVQATLWSGTHEVITSRGFTRDTHQVLEILTGYLGGATAFPIHILRDTYQSRRESDRPAHLLVISDDGVTTMFNQDERGTSGWEVSRTALACARGGGSLVLNLGVPPNQNADLVRASQEGWQIFRVQSWEDLVAFARSFSRRWFLRYAQKPK